MPLDWSMISAILQFFGLLIVIIEMRARQRKEFDCSVNPNNPNKHPIMANMSPESSRISDKKFLRRIPTGTVGLLLALLSLLNLSLMQIAPSGAYPLAAGAAAAVGMYVAGMLMGFALMVLKP